MLIFLVFSPSVFGYFVKRDHGDPFRCPKNWIQTFNEVQKGYSLVKNGNRKEAQILLAETARLAFLDLPKAFECSIGISALFRILAHAHVVRPQVALRMMHVSMNWLTHAFVKKGLNEGRWVDESSWPITIQEINDEETYIQQQIGAQGDTPVWPDCPLDYKDPNLRIGIVTMCDYPADNPLPALSMSNKYIYANRHGYTVIEERERTDKSRPHAWAKITLMEKHINRTDLDWLLWFDCDTYFMNLNITLDHVLHKFGGGEKMDSEFFMLIQEDHAMLNTGVFFMKTGQQSAQLLNKVYGEKDSPWIDHPWWENAAFSHLFLGDLPSRVREGDEGMKGIYPLGVRVAPQELFNSYHPVTSRIFMHDTWEEGKFVLAFSGCVSGSSPTVTQMLYVNYYRIMCEINNVKNECIDV